MSPIYPVRFVTYVPGPDPISCLTGFRSSARAGSRAIEGKSDFAVVCVDEKVMVGRVRDVGRNAEVRVSVAAMGP